MTPSPTAELHGCDSKNRYADETQARSTGRHRMQQGSGDLWVYPCGFCAGWHLTSKARAPMWHAQKKTSHAENFDDMTGDPLFWDRLAQMPEWEAEQLLRRAKANAVAAAVALTRQDASAVNAFISRLNDEIHLLAQSSDKARIWRAISNLYGADAVPAVRVELERLRFEERGS